MRVNAQDCDQNVDRGKPVALAQELSSFDLRVESYEPKMIFGVFWRLWRIGPATNSIFVVTFSS